MVYAFLISAFFITSCDKKDGGAGLTQPEENADLFSPVPTQFTQKILLEELTATWCGYCPHGSHYFHKVDSAFPGKVIGVAIHISDIMEDYELVSNSGYNMLDSTLFQNADSSDDGYPNGSVNRLGPLLSPTGWHSSAHSQIGLLAKCGLAIDASAISGNSLTVTVHAGFAQTLNSDYRLNVFLVESNVHSISNTSYDQKNYYSQSGSHPSSSYFYYGNATPVNYFDLPPSINGFKHDNVLRKLLTSIPFGDKIPVEEMVKGKHYVKTFTANLTGYDKSHCYIVAFIDKYGADFTNHQHQVQNVQRVKVGQIQYWD